MVFSVVALLSGILRTRAQKNSSVESGLQLIRACAAAFPVSTRFPTLSFLLRANEGEQRVNVLRSLTAFVWERVVGFRVLHTNAVSERR